MGSGKKIASGVLWSMIYNLVNGGYGFISVPLLINHFGKSNYGIIGLAMSINVYLQLMDLGFNSTNVRFFSNWLAKKDYGNVTKLFQTSLAFYGFIGLINGILLFILAAFSNHIFHLENDQYLILKYLLYILGISAIISWFTSCFDQLIKAHECVSWLQKISLFPKILQMLVLLFTILFNLTIQIYFAFTVFSLFFILPLAIAKIKTLAPYISFHPKFNKLIFKDMLPYCLNIFSFGIFQFSINSLRPVFLGIQGSMDSVADFRILNAIIQFVMMIGGAFMGVMLPTASKFVALGDYNAQNRIAYDGTKYISITLCFCCFCVMGVSRYLLLLYVGEGYLYLDFWLNIWLFITLLSHNQAISSLILSGSDIRLITYCTIIASLIGLGLCWYLIPFFEVGGTIIAYGIYCLIQIVFYYTYYWPKKMKLDSWRIFRYSFISSVIIGFISMYAVKFILFSMADLWSSLINVVWGTFLFSLIYLFLTWKVVLNYNDKSFFKGLLNQYLFRR